jgi:hypothetical protein
MRRKGARTLSPDGGQNGRPEIVALFDAGGINPFSGGAWGSPVVGHLYQWSTSIRKSGRAL